MRQSPLDARRRHTLMLAAAALAAPSTVLGQAWPARYGLAAPAGTPPAVVARVEQALEQLVRDPEVVRVMQSRGADTGFLGSSAMAAFMASDAAKWKRVASFAKITLG
jgi:tripartite-type tricarboxylate transporter receptor subunit TctC